MKSFISFLDTITIQFTDTILYNLNNQMYMGFTFNIFILFNLLFSETKTQLPVVGSR
jgi:hypothetical protein